MPALADVQAGMRHALIAGDGTALEPLLVGGGDARARLAIHQRHYLASLVTALLDRFPATVWLVGSAFVMDAARQFVRRHPPTRPCMAEYGEEFPAFLATAPGAAAILYLQQFAELEWRLGRCSSAVDTPHLTADHLSTIDARALEDARLTLQPGLHYLHADWAIDELISLYLADSAPGQFSLQRGDIWLELRGVRGELRMNRLAHRDFAFRAALLAGEPLGDAAVSALEIDAAFDAGQALLHLFGDRLVVTIEARHMAGAE